MSGYSFIFSKCDIVMTAYGMIHENTLDYSLDYSLPNGLVCQDLALQFWDMVY